MDRGAWWAIVHGITNSQKCLSMQMHNNKGMFENRLEGNEGMSHAEMKERSGQRKQQVQRSCWCGNVTGAERIGRQRAESRSERRQGASPDVQSRLQIGHWPLLSRKAGPPEGSEQRSSRSGF